MKVNTDQDNEIDIENSPVSMNDKVDSGEFSNDDVEDSQDSIIGVSNDNDNRYNSHFDAGVDADEEKDPRTYIQQLTGKLSQSLRKYNKDRNNPDVDLCKYVAGMINKQASEGLSEKDVEEIVGKIEAGRNNPDDVDNNDNSGTDPESGDITNKEDSNNGDLNAESISRDEDIEEVFNDIINTNNEAQYLNNSDNNISFKKKPFMPPSFK